MINVNLTEIEVTEKLITKSKELGEVSPRVVIVQRTVINPSKSIKRLVRFALIVSAGNEKLLDGLIAECVSNDMSFYFVGSDINLQNDLNIEYLYFEAEIMPKQIS